MNEPRSLIGFIQDVGFWKPEILEQERRRRIAAIEKRKDFLKTREEQLAGEIDGLDVEYEFNQIAKRSGARKSALFHGLSTFVDHNFSPKQKRIIFRLSFAF